MKKRFVSMILAILFVSATSMAQSTRDKMQKQSTDPRTRENAAKADQYIINKKIISDTTAEAKKAPGVAKQVSKMSEKKKEGLCKKRKKRQG